MRTLELWRTTTFRLTIVYGAVFAGGVVFLLGLVYWRTATALTERVDRIVRAESSALVRTNAAALPAVIRRQTASGAGQLNAYGLFSRDGLRVAGDIDREPTGLPIGGPICDVAPREGFPFRARALALRLPWGEVLVVGRDVGQIAEVRGFIFDALIWSGALIAGLGLVSGVVLSLGPLGRLQALQMASRRIMAGDLSARMPIAERRDELDLFAGMVNVMIEEVERLLSEAKSANDNVAHDLRTPLARVKARLVKLREEEGLTARIDACVGDAIDDLDLTLERFRALLRISEIEAQARRAGFRLVCMEDVLRDVVALYEPLAEARDIRIRTFMVDAPLLEADDKLLFEAISNLVDNAIKFSPEGGSIELSLILAKGELQVGVRDQGPGIVPEERQAVLQRFRRGSSAGSTTGSGLGLSIVAATARLHQFDLRLEDSAPGLRVTLGCPIRS